MPGSCEHLVQLGLAGVARLRARWFMRGGSYAPHPRDPETLRLVADLVIGVAMLARLTGRMARFNEDGIVELEAEQGHRDTLIVCSGGGSRRWPAVEAEVDLRRRAAERRGRRVHAALVAGVEPRREETPPASIVSGD